MPLHEWEDTSPIGASTADDADTDRDDGDFGGWGKPWEFEDDDGPEEARKLYVREFLDILETLYLSSKISAESFCTLCYFAGKGGMGEEVGKNGLKPGQSSGHYSRLLKRLMGMQTVSKEHYSLSVPGHFKHDYSRATHTLQARPVHEIVDSWVRSDPTTMEAVQAAVDKGHVPPNYFTNPVVMANPTECFVPLSLYIDGVPYSLTDSVVGIWIQNLVSRRRSIVAW